MATLSLDTVTLEKGGHESIDDGVCAMVAHDVFRGRPLPKHVEIVGPEVAPQKDHR